MLTFYINRAGQSLSKARRGGLERAKDALRKAFGRRQRLTAGGEVERGPARL